MSWYSNLPSPRHQHILLLRIAAITAGADRFGVSVVTPAQFLRIIGERL